MEANSLKAQAVFIWKLIENCAILWVSDFTKEKTNEYRVFNQK